MTDQTLHKSRPRVLSGMRPTGKLHLGNYVGALQNWVKLQNSHDCFFFVADWHALTTDYDDTNQLAANTLEVLLDWLGAGLSPEKCTMFIQSQVLQHAELHVLFSMITPLGWLERVPSYKDQQQNLKDKNLNTYGFLGYPLLQAADILIYQANFVPVGEDQVAHVELTREVARRFNDLFPKWGPTSRFTVSQGFPQHLPVSVVDKVFSEPQPLLTRIPKLLGTDGRKMSKSYGNSILLSEEESKLADKIRDSITDRPKLTDRGNPDRCPIGNLHQIFSEPETLAHITLGCTQASIKCIECKALAYESVNKHLEPIRIERRKWAQDRESLKKIILGGAEKAQETAEKTMMAARQAVGVLNPISLTRRVPAIESTYPSLAEREIVQTSVEEKAGNINQSEQTSRVRDWWIGNCRKIYALRDVGHNTFVTRNNRRVAVAVPSERRHQCWRFSIPDRHYDALALLCIAPSNFASEDVADFVIPMKSIKGWKIFRREGKNIVFDVRQINNDFLLESESEGSQNITNFYEQYEFLE